MTSGDRRSRSHRLPWQNALAAPGLAGAGMSLRDRSLTGWIQQGQGRRPAGRSPCARIRQRRCPARGARASATMSGGLGMVRSGQDQRACNRTPRREQRSSTSQPPIREVQSLAISGSGTRAAVKLLRREAARRSIPLKLKWVSGTILRSKSNTWSFAASSPALPGDGGERRCLLTCSGAGPGSGLASPCQRARHLPKHITDDQPSNPVKAAFCGWTPNLAPLRGTTGVAS